MPCVPVGGVAIVYMPPQGITRRQVQPCPTCNRKTRQVVYWQGVWNGSVTGCLACGDEWSEGEIFPRPFQRGWREKRKAKLLAAWKTALAPAEYRRVTQQQITETLEWDEPA